MNNQTPLVSKIESFEIERNISTVSQNIPSNGNTVHGCALLNFSSQTFSYSMEPPNQLETIFRQKLRRVITESNRSGDFPVQKRSHFPSSNTYKSNGIRIQCCAKHI